MNILVIGAGYVGLVSAACLAEMGHRVICLDIDEKKIVSLNKGVIPIYEPGLEELVLRNGKAGRLSFTSAYPEAIAACQICIIAVATPEAPDGSCDLRFIFSAAQSIGRHLDGYRLVVIKSTVPVGTTEQVGLLIQEELNKRGLSHPFDMVSNPEFLKEGSAIADCLKPERIILGVDSQKAREEMRSLYTPFTMNHDRMIFMTIRSAEMTKYAANAMLATRISFMNELANLCEKVGANIHDVRIGIGSDSRIGYQFLYAGVGYGGSCFPKDLRALQIMAKQADASSHLIDAVEHINQKQKLRLLEKIKAYFKGELKGRTIAIWGLAFKPNTDDMREAPSLALIRALVEEGIALRLYDPIAMDSARNALASISFPPESKDLLTYCDTEFEAAEGADAIALVTEWKQFRFLDLGQIRKSMKGKGFFDGRNQYKPDDMKEKGFDYHAIGVSS
jgi:UDPglucose 6-dehydrogenase